MASPRAPTALFSVFRRLPGWVLVVLLLLAAIALMGIALGRIAIQAAIQGLIVGAIYVLGASGLSLTYGIKRFANFAHGDLMTAGAYAAFAVNVSMGQHIGLAIAVSILTVAILAMFLELSIFRHLEGRPVAALIASVGIALVIQNVISAIFLTEPKQLNIAIPRDIPIGDTGLSFNLVKGGVTIAISVAFIVFVHVLLRYTTLGKAMRACADNLELARTSGIHTRNVILWTWAITGALASVAGILVGLVVPFVPLTGSFILLFIFAAVIIGGIGSPYGAMLGGLIVGLIQKLSGVVFGKLGEIGLIEGGAGYEPAGAFLVMIVVLLLRPEGIMGIRRPGTGPGRLHRIWLPLRRGAVRE